MEGSRADGQHRPRRTLQGVPGWCRRRRRPRPDDRRRRVLRPARPLRLRQDHAAADHRRAGGGHRRASSCSAARTSRRCRPGKRDVAMVFQDYALFPHMDVTDNIAYPLRIQKVGRRERAREGRRDRRRARAGDADGPPPGQLSGGQQQRVALARAIACQPAVFLFDEPLSNLDARLRLEARTFLKRLQHELSVTTVFVTHDQAEALAMADTIAVMEAGHIRQIGTPVGRLPPPGQRVRRELHRLDADEPACPAAPSDASWSPRGTTCCGSGSGAREVPSPWLPARSTRGSTRPVRSLDGDREHRREPRRLDAGSVSCGDHSVQALVPEGEEPEPVDAEVSLSPGRAGAALPGGRRRAARTVTASRRPSTGDAARPARHLDARTTGPRTSAPQSVSRYRAGRRVPGRARVRPAARRGARPRLRGAGRLRRVVRRGTVRTRRQRGLGDAGLPARRRSPGTWQVLVGLHRVPPPGVDYRLTVRPATHRRGGGGAGRRARGAAGARTRAAPGAARTSTGCGGWPRTSTRTPSTPTARSAIEGARCARREPRVSTPWR